jgi:hypothetical protein
MAEPIVIVLQTWQRTDVALRTIVAACKYLHYDDLRWYVADDGSDAPHLASVYRALEAAGAHVIGGHSERRGYGGNANAAWDVADSVGALTLWLEDDWELTAPLDLYPYAALLMERIEVGMVRLGVLNLDIHGRTWGHHGRLYWTLDHIPHIEGTPVSDRGTEWPGDRMARRLFADGTVWPHWQRENGNNVMNDYPPPQQPPFAGNAWYHAVIPEGDPLPEGAEDCGPTAGGQLIKFRWGPEVEYTATRPAWR